MDDAPAKISPQTRKSNLDDAFRSPTDVNGILLSAQLKSDAKTRANLDLKIAVASLGLSAGNGVHTGEIDVLLLQRNETGDTFGRVNETITMNFRDVTYQKLLGEGIRYHREISIVPQATKVRVVVREASTGSIGSLTIPLPTQ